MDWSKDKIFETCMSIMADSDTLSKQQMDEKYEIFKKKFSKIYQMCSSTSSSIERQSILREISMMLGIREDIKTDKKDAFVGNVQIGEHFAKKYIYPKVGEPSLEDRKNALDKLSKEK